SEIVLSWQSGLDAVGPGGFYLTDGFGGFLFPPVPMHEDTSFSHSSFNSLSGGFVDIVVGDGSLMRTFTLDSLALGTDSKGKYQKYEKRKPWATDFRFTAVVPAGGANQMYIDLKKYTDGTVSFPGDTTGRLPVPITFLKKTTLTFAPPLYDSQLVVVEGRSYKQTKPFIQKYRWFLAGEKSDYVLATYNYQYQRLRMPNVNNLGEELYLAATMLPVGINAQVDTTARLKPIFRYISHPKKWKDVTKSLLKKVSGIYQLQDGPANCLDTIKSKEVYKAYKYLDPKGAIRHKTTAEYGNELIGQLIALKFNIAISAKGHTPSMGFGDLIYTGDGHPFDGKTVSQIEAVGDSALACVGTMPGGYSYAQFADFLDTLNREFSGPFDTVVFATKTIVTGIKPVVESNIFVGSGATFEPVVPTDFASLYDVPERYDLAQNYPNPFNPTTTIEFQLAADALVTIRVYNMLGQLVATLVENEDFSSGENWVEFDASRLSSGVYLYHMVAKDLERGSVELNKVKKMVLLK
ncbi:MAG TPA: T9SS type A sorting domain-containing protein, partial [Bacteroidota bacterium]|nr:T9SS type A sorting domain-containing protein [Bacteroidota bacterium]